MCRVRILVMAIVLVTAFNACVQYPIMSARRSYSTKDSIDIIASKPVEVDWCFDRPKFDGASFIIERKDSSGWIFYKKVSYEVCTAFAPGTRHISKGELVYKLPAPKNAGTYRIQTVDADKSRSLERREVMYSNEFTIE